jgi:hypothetical protein
MQFLPILCSYVSVCLNDNIVTFVHSLLTQRHESPRTARLHNPGKGDEPFRHFTKSHNVLQLLTFTDSANE